MWDTPSKDLIFMYTTDQKEIIAEMSIYNSGKYEIEYVVDYNNEIYEIDQKGGTLKEKEYHNFTVKLLKNQDLLPFIVLKNMREGYSQCYSELLFSTSSVLVDCKITDMEAIVQECNGINRVISYSFITPKTCREGLKLPKNNFIPCGMRPHN